MKLPLLVVCLSISVSAQTPPPVTLTASGGLTHNLIRKLLPLQSQLTSNGQSMPFWFADLYFCGSDTVGTSAKVLGIVYPGSAPAQMPSPVLTGADCKDSFAGLKGRIQAQPTGSFVATTLSLSWERWNASFRVTQAQVIGNASSSVTNLRSSLNATAAPIATFSTAGVNIPLSDQVNLPLDAALSFDRDSTLITLFLANTGTTPQTAAIPQLPSSINSDVRVPYDFLNFVVKNHLPNQHFLISKGDAGTVELVQPSVSFTLDELQVNGVLHHVESNQNFPVLVTWSKSDLTLSYIKLTPQLESCADGDVECRLRNTVLNSVAAKVQARLLALYQGSPLHPTSFSNPLAFTALGIPLQARIQTVQGSASQAGLELNEIISLEKK